MKKLLLSACCLFLLASRNNIFAAPAITLTTVPTAAANINQGSSANIIYVAKMDVSAENITVTSINVPLVGTYDADDLNNVQIYYSLVSPNLSSAALGATISGVGTAPHVYTVPTNRLFAAGTTVYIIVVAGITNTATDNHTVYVDGAASPLTISATVAPVVTNNQQNLAGVQTIQAADVVLSTVSTAAGNIGQGTSSNIIYIARVEIGTEPLTINNVQFTLNGTYDANDLESIRIFYSLVSPSLASAALAATATANFAGPHAVSIPAQRSFPSGSTVYIIVAANTSGSSSDDHTLFVDGATQPLTITTPTAPNIDNIQSNIAGVQTIQAADISLSTVPLAPSNLNPGTNFNIIYVAKMVVATEPVTVSQVQVDLGGTYDADDLGNITVYYSLVGPNLASAATAAIAAGNFSGPHTFTIPTVRSFPAGSTVYIIITANINSNATDNNSIYVDGAAHPLTISSTTVPNVVNTQSNISGTQTIQAADINLSTVVLPTANLIPGTNANFVYVLKTDVGTQPVTINSIQVTLGGNYDADDIGMLRVYSSSVAPSLTSASLVSSMLANVAGPHTFTFLTSKALSAGSVNYLIFTIDVNSDATIGHSIGIDGAVNPVVLGFTTTPNIANSQSNVAGIFNIANAALPLKLMGFTATPALSANAVQLQWVTASETNTKMFEVEWSSNGSSFVRVGEVMAHGSSTITEAYSFMHTAPADGNNFYRLKMLDVDGSYTWSPIVRFQLRITASQVSIAPNPVRNQLHVILNNTSPVKQLRIFDAGGRLVWQLANPANAGIIYISTTQLGGGLYVLEVSRAEDVQRIAFIK